MNKKLLASLAAVAAMSLSASVWAETATSDEVIAKVKESAAAVAAGS